MKLGIGQINPKVGDVSYNTSKIVDTISLLGKESDLLVFPELSLVGAPLQGMVCDEDLVFAQQEALQKIRDAILSTSDKLKVVLGYVEKEGDCFYNAAAVVGEDIQIIRKSQLRHQVYDLESAYFSGGKESDFEPLRFSFGEDLKGVLVVGDDLSQQFVCEKDELLICLNNTPFTIDSLSKRLEAVTFYQQQKGGALLEVNQVGGQGEQVYDGASLFVDHTGKLQRPFKRFEEDIICVDTTDFVDVEQKKQIFADNISQNTDAFIDWDERNIQQQFIEMIDDKYGGILEAMKLGLRDYLEKTGLQNVVIGISGGIDSAISLAVLSQVIDPSHIYATYMPTKHNSDLSYQLSLDLCKRLGVELRVAEIDDLVKQFCIFGEDKLQKKPEGIAYENIQSRLRGIILMNLANMYQALVLNNSNRTELEMGYGTLYGDLIGGYGLLGDLNKSEIYEFARYLNEHCAAPIPEKIITRKASAELADGQVDPFDYEHVSFLLEEMEMGASVKDLVKKYGMREGDVLQLKERMRRNGFKARQMPPMLKLKEKSIGDARMKPLSFG